MNTQRLNKKTKTKKNKKIKQKTKFLLQKYSVAFCMFIFLNCNEVITRPLLRNSNSFSCLKSYTFYCDLIEQMEGFKVFFFFVEPIPILNNRKKRLLLSFFSQNNLQVFKKCGVRECEVFQYGNQK